MAKAHSQRATYGYGYNLSESIIRRKLIRSNQRRSHAKTVTLTPGNLQQPQRITGLTRHATAAHRHLSGSKFNKTRFTSIPELHKPIACLIPVARSSVTVASYRETAEHILPECNEFIQCTFHAIDTAHHVDVLLIQAHSSHPKVREKGCRRL